MTTAKKILFISYDGMTDPLGQSQVIPYLEGLTSFGYEFTVLSCEKPARYKKYNQHIADLLRSYNIQWAPVPYHKNPPVLSSIFDYFRLKNRAAKLHKEQNFKMVHTRPGIPTLVALWMKKKYGVKFLNDVRGFWADERVDGGMWNIKNPVYKMIYSFFKQHEFECIEKADQITCLTFRAQKEIQSWKNISGQPKPVEVIPCSVDLRLFNPEKFEEPAKNKLRERLGIHKDDFVLSYLGSIGGWYLTGEMMHFCKLLSEKISNIKFLFIAPHQHELILKTAKTAGIPENKIIVTEGQREQIPLLLLLSNYSLFFIRPCYSKISSSPTKHGEIMAMGIPVITNAGVGDVGEIVSKYDAGIVIKEFNDPEYLKAIEMILSGKVFDSKGIRQGAIAYYNLETAVQKYRSVYKKVTGD